eukprot:scaffold66710_cov47-Attheya_sp.AAC.5
MIELLPNHPEDALFPFASRQCQCHRNSTSDGGLAGTSHTVSVASSRVQYLSLYSRESSLRRMMGAAGTGPSAFIVQCPLSLSPFSLRLIYRKYSTPVSQFQEEAKNPNFIIRRPS